MSIHANTAVSVVTACDAIEAIIINACEALEAMDDYDIDTPEHDFWTAEEQKFNDVLLQVFNLQVMPCNLTPAAQYRIYKYDRGRVIRKSRVFYVNYCDNGEKGLCFIG